MSQIAVLIPIALLLGFVGLVAFLWALRSGQFDDLDGAAWRILQDEDETPPTDPAERRDRQDGEPRA
jgi:cbb3-type cytochrome oxidase maturation protein